jgi:hypothetical protein
MNRQDFPNRWCHPWLMALYARQQKVGGNIWQVKGSIRTDILPAGKSPHEVYI